MKNKQIKNNLKVGCYNIIIIQLSDKKCREVKLRFVKCGRDCKL